MPFTDLATSADFVWPFVFPLWPRSGCGQNALHPTSLLAPLLQPSFPPFFRFKFPPHSLAHTHLAHTPRYLICGPWQPDGCLCGLVAGVLPVTEKLVGAESYPLRTHEHTDTHTSFTPLSPHKPSARAGSRFPACFVHPGRNLGWINP